MKVKVGINGYGTIGKRVATAVNQQDDMEIVGITKTRPTYEAKDAARQGYPIYVPEESLEAFKDAGIPILDGMGRFTTHGSHFCFRNPWLGCLETGSAREYKC